MIANPTHLIVFNIKIYFLIFFNLSLNFLFNFKNSIFE